MIVNRSGCAVLSVNYRLAPEHKYPAALNDVVSAIDWVRENARQFGLDEQRIAVGGDSSGANLAAAAALFCRDHGASRLLFQLLVYPALDHRYDTDSYVTFGDGRESALSQTDVVWFHEQYVSRPEELDLPYVSPLRAESLEYLPPTLIVCAEVDPLLDEGKAYAQRLRKAGVPVDLKIYGGMFHGFWRMGGALAEARRAIDHAGTQLRSISTAK
jgi:acetyl esterase